MKHILYILTFTVVFTQSLEVEGDLHVTGDLQAAKIDSLEAVIAQLQSQISNLENLHFNSSTILFHKSMPNEGRIYCLLSNGEFWNFHQNSNSWYQSPTPDFNVYDVIFMENLPAFNDWIFCLLRNGDIWHYQINHNTWYQAHDGPPFDLNE